MKEKEIKVILNGEVREVIKRQIINGDVCFVGDWYKVTDGTIDISDKMKAIEEAKKANHAAKVAAWKAGKPTMPSPSITGNLAATALLMGLAAMEEY